MRPLSQIEEELRRAVLNGHLADVQRLSAEFCQTAEAGARSTALSAPAIAALAARVDGVLHWTMDLVIAARQRIASQLAHVPQVRTYLEPPPSGNVRLSVDG